MSTAIRPTDASVGIRDRVRAHPLVAFFSLAGALSWIAWIPYVLSADGLGVLDFRFPALLGSTQLTGVLPGAYLGPIGSALLITWLVDGRAGLRAWAGRLLRWRVSARWYAISLLAAPLGMLLVGIAFSGGLPHAPSAAALIAYLPVLALQFVTTGLAEEPGWRDFALVRLQRAMSPLRAALVLGPIWGLWHMPLFLTEWGGWPNAHWSRPIVFMVFCMAFNIVMSWVFNRANASLPLSMLMHVSVNTFASVLWSEMFPTLDDDLSLPAMATGAVVAAVVILVATRGRLGLPAHPPLGSRE